MSVLHVMNLCYLFSDLVCQTQRGKFRPRLTELVQQNSPQSVEDITEKAFAEMPNLKAAIRTLSQMKAVGPATASGQSAYSFCG